jgi:hypothetical protein
MSTFENGPANANAQPKKAGLEEARTRQTNHEGT